MNGKPNLPYRPDHQTAFHLMVKPTGAACNLDCHYCFFLSKELLYPDSRFRMSDEVLHAYLDQLLESQRHLPEVTIAWQGGEPTLMGLDFFRRAVAYAKKRRHPRQSLAYTIQTNGTRLDDDWCTFFKENDFLVGISLDGPRALHDAYRVDKGGRGTFDQVMGGVACLQQHDVDFNVLTTVHAANADYPREVYRFLRDEVGAEFMQFIPIVERATREMLPLAEEGWSVHPGDQRPLYRQQGSLVTGRSVRPEQYGRFLRDIFEEWVRRDVGRVYVQLFDVTLGSFLGQHTLCVFAPTCGDALALEHNGDLYSCDHYVEPDYLLGNIADAPLVEMVNSPSQRQFGRDKLASLPRYCQECEVRFLCHGGCPRNRFIKTPDGEPGLNYLCAGYKLFFNHVLQPMALMADLLRQQRPPAEIMKLYARRDADAAGQEVLYTGTGRNDPCPCGSGRKFKRCHGQRR